MPTATFLLNHLPFDVLLHVIEALDHRGVCSLCLVSRGFDALATPVLYKSVKWDEEAGFRHPTTLGENFIYRPCLAFRRRPFLRNHVRVVTFTSRTGRWGEMLTMHGVGSISEELRLLPSLYKIQWLSWEAIGSSLDRQKFSPIADTMAQLGSVRAICLPSLPYGSERVLCKMGQKFTAISVRVSHEVVKEWLEQQREHLKELNIAIADGSIIDLPNKFHALRRFSLGAATNLPQVLAVIKEMRRLVELSIGINPQRFDSWEVGPSEAAELKKLQSLKIDILQGSQGSQIYGYSGEQAAEAVFYCYTTLGMNSQDLQTLHICAVVPSQLLTFPGDKLIFKIINKHAGSIRSLRLDDMTANTGTLVQLFSRCAQLKEVGLTLTGPAVKLSTIGTPGTFAAALQRLSLVIAQTLGSPPDEKDVEIFLLQAMPHLRRINLCIAAGYNQPANYACWERRWLYDEDLGGPRQYIAMMPRSKDLWRDNN